MKQICRFTFIGMSFLALMAGCASTPSNRAETEDALIAKLSSPDESTVISTMTRYKKLYRGSTKAFPALKKLLTDSRLKVKERAAGLLGSFHADVSEEDVKAICALLKEPMLEAGPSIPVVAVQVGLTGAATA